jgi:arylsulfatase A-like enzyme/HEAT repeat protein
MDQDENAIARGFRRLSPVAPAVLCGAVAGLVAAALDVVSAASALASACDIALLALQAAARVGAAGMAIAAIAAIAVRAGAAIGRRRQSDERQAAAALIALAAAPALVWVSIRLFQGGVTSLLPARPALIALAAAVLIALVYAGARAALALIARADAAARRDPVVFAAAIALTAAAIGLRWCDAHLYRRLYLYLHALLAAGTLAGLALALRLAFAPRARRVPGVAVAVVVLVLAAACAAAAMSLDLRQAVKVALDERTATAANVLRLTSGLPRTGAGPAPSAAARRARYDRERRQRAAEAASDLPALPGAHLVLITIDTLRADRIGAYGNTARRLTPRIDELAARSTVFERAYCTAPHSSYSISSMHTSRYVHDEAILGKPIAHPTIADELAAAGYATTAFYTQGIFFTEGDNVGYYRKNRFGFATASHGAPKPAQLTDAAIAEVDRLVARGEPAFFLWVHYFNVHEPYLSERFGSAPRDRYDGEIFIADAEVGRLVDSLDRKLARDAVIVLASDHGEEFEDHGGQYHGSSLFDEQVRVPLVVRVPGAAPRRVRTPVSLVDLAPTALALLGRAPAAGMAGRDLRPAIAGGDAALPPRPVFASVMREHMALAWPWKLLADPSRQIFQLFDLAADPRELTNRYDDRRDVADGLADETRLWLDDLSRGDDPADTALALGRMRDARALEELFRLAEDRAAPAAKREEALALIAEIRAWRQLDRLDALLADPDAGVARAAALALAAMRIDKGRDLLREALYDGDPAIRDEAALALGGLGDPAAVPALIEALGRDDLKIREDAIRLLGDLRDPAAVEPLIETVAEERTRYLSVLALGKIGDARAYDTLLDVLAYDRHTDVRGYAVVALGWMGATAAVPRLLRILAEEPEIKWTGEALVRLGAVGTAPLFGTDLAKGAPALVSGWGDCVEKELVLPDEFLARTKCATKGTTARLAFAADAPRGATLLVRARHLLADKGAPVPLAITVDRRVVATVELRGEELREERVEVGPGVFTAGKHTIELRLGEPGAFEVDHFLVLAK